MSDKLTLTEIAPYLPYGLKYHLYGDFPIREGKTNIVDEIKELNPYDGREVQRVIEWATIKPILYPISHLTKPMDDGSVPLIVELAKISFPDLDFIFDVGNAYCEEQEIYFRWNGNGFTCWKEGLKGYLVIPNQLALFQYMASKKIDFMGLIERGLAVDATTLNVNPYSNE